MDSVVVDEGSLFETTVFLNHFKDMPDPRQRSKVMYPLEEVLLLALLAVLAGADSFVDIARFGCEKRELLRRFKPFLDGTPSHDHLGDIFAALDAEQFQRCFVAWVAAMTGVPAGVVAIDGKTVRRSGGKAGKGAIHMVSAFAARQRLVLGQVKVAEKSNEITAIPRLLDLLAIEGAIVTIDAMGCQRAIARKIVDKKADYVFGLKGNQGSLREDVDLFVAEQKAQDFKDTTISRAETIDADNGRIETRTTTVIHDVDWLQKRHAWPGLKAVVMVESIRETAGVIERETRLYITSLVMLAALIGPVIRSHWAIENSLHCWCGRPPAASMCQNEVGLVISDKGDRPWTRLAELEWIRRSTFFNFTGLTWPKRRFCGKSYGARTWWRSSRSSLRRWSQLKPVARAIIARGCCRGLGIR
jgi:predicted transposase YbfD/YdcC